MPFFIAAAILPNLTLAAPAAVPACAGVFLPFWWLSLWLIFPKGQEGAPLGPHFLPTAQPGRPGAVGLVRPLTGRLVRSRGMLHTQGNVGHLTVWGAGFVANQLIVIFTGRPANGALLPPLASTGLVVGNCASTLVLFYRTR